MTTDKARKRAVRARMTKTGERYAAARRHVAPEPPDAAGDAQSVQPLPPLPPRVAEPGSADAAVQRATGRGWDDWFRILDGWGGTAHTHTEIARHLSDAHGVPGWWAQNVTVGYERARGMRAVHETPRGFGVTVSKTIETPVVGVWPLVREAERRAGWVEPGLLRYRSETAGKRVSFAVEADGTSVSMHLAPKDDGRTTITVVHEKLDDAEAVERERARWRERLARLAEGLRPSAAVAAGRRRAS